MNYQVQEMEKQALVTIKGELDMAVGEKLGNLIREVGQRKQSVILDFHGVTFVDSSGIGNLFYTTKELLASGKHVEIVNVQEDILDILRVLGFVEALGVKVSTCGYER
ncbi:STAS domain-containing protein [Brevibacillus massiliensis]|jgi:stage II sporulation protein AA (anti-sigma F factor antagonist)|uniref:STAS domain-containing protein n=1 Tax=Brevibacillus massiliensis TaxID=1118054 RepID=UPI0002D56AF5|nr:STAS domain-containing protein [Brevibacillus massiliensis]